MNKAALLALLAFTLQSLAASASPAAGTQDRLIQLAPGESERVPLGTWQKGQFARLHVALADPILGPDRRVQLTYEGPASHRVTKTLHEGDPDLLVRVRAVEPGNAALHLRSTGNAACDIRLIWHINEGGQPGASAFETEPNDDWTTANPLPLDRAIYGLADDVDYLENKDEGRAGIDWFRIDFEADSPRLVYLWLDLLDRDVSCNLRLYRVIDGRAEPYLEGKDPNEVIHDRERERYSKHISRVLSRGVYYLEVNANHPDYVLRSRVLDLPPYKKAAQAIDAGAQYLMQIGDAWFNQIPREGNIYTRAASLHDTATRCTACHPAAFPTEATLAAVKAGYHLRARRSYDYVIERIYNSPAPLYGGEAYFQRFIAIPLQAQGKQGGILLDHERLVSGRPTRTVERFAPFLAAAWSERTELPADEQNGVIPADSKFGIAWRDWRVLHELGDRAGNPAWQRASDRIRDLLLDSAANKKVETFQDRIHRVRAWSLLDSLGQKPRIQAEIDDFWRLQNEDGGWHEIDSKKGPSAVYTTGQLVWTLAEVGVPADAPGMQRAIEFLLKEQQPFGGWIQTTTHENFRTPMRETRFAVMALASTHPRPAAPPPPLAQGDAQPKASLRTGEGDIALLDDLEALWDLPEPERSARELAVIGLLEHPEPTVRAAAAAALGRIGGPPSVPPLLEKLADSAKPVWRAAAWALRRLGNKGIGVDAIRLALSADNPRIRRGAARVFAYQFHGMDERPEIAMRLIELSQDPDLWTRLQAIKTLRHWFYRTSDDTQKRRIVYAHLAGLDRDEHPVIRRNWIEGLYIIMDENLGGGVSLQKNLAQLPEPARARALAHRSSLEDRVLLQPILAAIASGSARQREGILRAFDGSFFAGRFYARRPTGMIDVGNDREFGFLHDPGTPALERAFVPLFQSDLSPPAYLDALKLAAFFDLPARATSPVLVSALRPEALRNAGVVITSAPPAGPPVDPPANSPAEPRSIGRLPSFEAFRVHINPIFYKPSADGVSCAKCHGTHEILRLAPPPAQGDFSDDDVRQNYASTLKVIDRANPEKSLVLRKPLSPHGQGEPDPSSPTGITHVGGPRWEDPDPPDYRALLRWIRGESPVANDSPQPASDKPR